MKSPQGSFSASYAKQQREFETSVMRDFFKQASDTIFYEFKYKGYQ